MTTIAVVFVALDLLALLAGDQFLPDRFYAPRSVIKQERRQERLRALQAAADPQTFSRRRQPMSESMPTQNGKA